MECLRVTSCHVHLAQCLEDVKLAGDAVFSPNAHVERYGRFIRSRSDVAQGMDAFKSINFLHQKFSNLAFSSWLEVSYIGSRDGLGLSMS